MCILQAALICCRGNGRRRSPLAARRYRLAPSTPAAPRQFAGSTQCRPREQASGPQGLEHMAMGVWYQPRTAFPFLLHLSSTPQTWLHAGKAPAKAKPAAEGEGKGKGKGKVRRGRLSPAAAWLVCSMQLLSAGCRTRPRAHLLFRQWLLPCRAAARRAGPRERATSSTSSRC